MTQAHASKGSAVHPTPYDGFDRMNRNGGIMNCCGWLLESRIRKESWFKTDKRMMPTPRRVPKHRQIILGPSLSFSTEIPEQDH
jgi:hypothetical protein